MILVGTFTVTQRQKCLNYLLLEEIALIQQESGSVAGDWWVSTNMSCKGTGCPQFNLQEEVPFRVNSRFKVAWFYEIAKAPQLIKVPAASSRKNYFHFHPLESCHIFMEDNAQPHGASVFREHLQHNNRETLPCSTSLNILRTALQKKRRR